MLRPMTSNVAALSGVVANGHQAIHLVSAAPSKIPYGGFSPVRLQTRLTPRPPSRAQPRPLIGRHCRYLQPRRFILNGPCGQSAPRFSDHDRESSGPWLPVRLCCPVGSSLTMATSAPLTATQRLMTYSAELRVSPARRRGSPICSARPSIPCRCPYSGGSDHCARRCLRGRFRLRPLCPGSATTRPTPPELVGCVTKRQHSLNATAWNGCLPCSGQDFYNRACMGRVAPRTHVGYDYMVHRHLPLPDCLRLDWQPYGLHAKTQSGILHPLLPLLCDLASLRREGLAAWRENIFRLQFLYRSSLMNYLRNYLCQNTAIFQVSDTDFLNSEGFPPA